MTERPRVVIHVDLDAFYAAVEVIEKPELADEPLIIGGRVRGVVATASYRARAFGVHSAMPMTHALKLCPNAVVLPARHNLYRDYSRRVMAIVQQFSPLVEQMSIDEAYVDLTEQVTGWDAGVAGAECMQTWIMQDVGLSASLGVATNKLVAKVASDRDKPGGLTVVRPGEEMAFLAPLPVRVLWGVGPVTEANLAQLGITTVGQLAQMSHEELTARFGRHGQGMARRAQGIDTRRLVTEREAKSVSQETTFSHDLRNAEELRDKMRRLSERVAERLQRRGLAAGTVAIKLRYSDFTTLTRQMSLSVPTNDTVVIYRTALVLMRRTWERDKPVRLLGVAARHLSSPPRQLPLL